MLLISKSILDNGSFGFAVIRRYLSLQFERGKALSGCHSDVVNGRKVFQKCLLLVGNSISFVSGLPLFDVSYSVAQAFLKAQGNWLVFLPPYSPDLNPIEMAFSKLKAHLRRMKARTFDTLFEAVAEACELFPQQECQNCGVICTLNGWRSSSSICRLKRNLTHPSRDVIDLFLRVCYFLSARAIPNWA